MGDIHTAREEFWIFFFCVCVYLPKNGNNRYNLLETTGLQLVRGVPVAPKKRYTSGTYWEQGLIYPTLFLFSSGQPGSMAVITRWSFGSLGASVLLLSLLISSHLSIHSLYRLTD